MTGFGAGRLWMAVLNLFIVVVVFAGSTANAAAGLWSASTNSDDLERSRSTSSVLSKTVADAFYALFAPQAATSTHPNEPTKKKEEKDTRSDVSTGSAIAVATADALVEVEAQPSPMPTIDPDSGIVINWTALDEIASAYTPTPQEEWLPPPTANCSCLYMKYRPLYCLWYLKPFRDPFDLVVTETTKWPVSRKLLSCHDNNPMLNGPTHTGMPMIAFFGTECCRVYSNATQGYMALSSFDDCWYADDELQKCFSEGHKVPRSMTALTQKQYDALLRNGSYADRATPHL